MLKNRNLILLGLVLIALAVISIVQRTSHRRATSRSDTSPVLAAEYDQDDLRRIEIGYGAETTAVVLENLPDGWVVRTGYDHQASQQRIDGLLRSLTDLAGEFLADAAEVLPDYGFTDSTTLVIAGYGEDGGTPILSLEVGKKPERSVGNFIKLPGSNAVYLTRQGILSSLGLHGGPDLPKSSHFYELQAYKVERNDVDAITLYDGDTVVALEKEFAEPEPIIAEGDSVAVAPEIDRKVYEWKLTQPQRRAALKTKADAVLGAVTTVRAVDIDDPAGDRAAYGLDAPAKRAEIRMQDGSVATIVFGTTRPESKGNQPGVYMQINDEPTVWVVSEYLLKNMFKTDEELLPEEES